MISTLGRYKVISEIGQGAMGTVYKAVDPIIDRTVAIKTINLNLSRQELEEYEARFQQEIKAAGRLNHPNIVTIYDVGKTDQVAYMAMEFLEGQELKDIITTRAPTEAEIKFARDSLVLQLPGSNETAGEVAGSYADVLTYGLKDTYWNDYVDEVRAITPQKLTMAAQKLIHPDALTWVIVGDLSKIEAGVRKLNLGEVKVLDADGKVLR